MPSYADTVIANGVDALWRHDELSGDVMLDSSGNNEHGTYFPEVIFGIGSPIETDPASRAVYGKTGKKIVAPASTLDRRDNFAWQAWGYNEGGSSPRTLICRNGHWSLGGSNILGINGSERAAVGLAVGGVSYSLTSPVLPIGFWYYIVLVRIANVMRLYVNGYLDNGNERTDLALGDINIGGATDGYYIGLMEHDQGVWFNRGQDESAIGPALTAEQILENYEAALAVLPIAATISVRVSVELDTDQIIPVDFPFAHNFANPILGSETPITEILSYKTNVNQSEPDYQQRINAQPHHAQRTLEYMITPTSANARAKLHSALWTPGEVYKLPVWTDWMPLTAQATATDNSLSLDTTKRDYQVGSYVVICSNVRDPSTYQYFLITSVADGSLGISPNVITTVPIGSPAAPARLACLPEESLSVESHLADRETGIFQFEVLSTELSTRRVTAYTPTATYKSVEVFSLEKAKVEWLDPSGYEINRRQLGTGNPTGNNYQRAVDTGSPQTIPLRVLLTTRTALSEFYGWMDARQGKQNPVWIISNEADFEVSARAASSLTVTNTNYKARYNVHHGRRDIAILKTNGAYVYHRISAAVDNGNGTETLTVNATTPLLVDISKVSFLKFCTAPDMFELKFHRDISIAGGMTVESSFVMSELLTSPA